MPSLKSICVLVDENGHQATREKLKGIYNAISSDYEKALELPLSEREKIRAIASLFMKVDSALIDALPNLEIISSFGVGYDHIDAQYATKKGVVVSHTPHVLDDEVADTTVALLLNTVRGFYHREAYLRAAQWTKNGSAPLSALSMRGRSVGIFGLGRIGQTIAKRLSGFDLPIHYHSRNQVDGVDYIYHSTLKEMAQNVDTLIVVVPATPQTHHAINADILKALGPRGVLINVGRGPVVDEKALIHALENNIIAAAGLDVFEHEPEVPQALIDLPNASLLPHVASASVDTRQAMGDLVVENLYEWFTNGAAVTPTPETKQLNSKT